MGVTVVTGVQQGSVEPARFEIKVQGSCTILETGQYSYMHLFFHFFSSPIPPHTSKPYTFIQQPHLSPPVLHCQHVSLLSVTGWPGADRAGKDTNSFS